MVLLRLVPSGSRCANASRNVGRTRLAPAFGQRNPDIFRSEDEMFYENQVFLNRGGLRLFLDTANVSCWEELMPTGIWYGITTNPLILERCGVRCDMSTLKGLVEKAHKLGAKEVQLQTFGANVDDMVRTGRALAALGHPKFPLLRIVVKVPATTDGFKTATQLIAEGIPITITGVYNPAQVLAAVSLGADYAAPYLGRMNAAARDGRGACLTMRDMLEHYDSSLRLLVASIKSVGELVDLAAHGCDTFTVGEDVARALFFDPLTEQAALDFDGSARKMGGYDDPPNN